MSKLKFNTIFVDAQEMALLHPNTFIAPSKKELKKIKKNSIVKVCVNKERFWVIVHSIKRNTIIGEVNNDLIFSDQHGLKIGDIIKFEKRNVYDIFTEEPPQ